MKTKYILIVLLLLGIFGYFIKDRLPLEILDKQKTTGQQVSNNFLLKSTYLGNNTWEYTVTAQLPNPCYSANVQAFIAESYPEQVTINVQLINPSPDQICTQVIQDFSFTGNFSASEKANIKLVVN